MATILATDLGVDLEFVAFEEENLVSNLQQGLFDVAMSGIAMDAEQMFQVGYSTPVMELRFSSSNATNSKSTPRSVAKIVAICTSKPTISDCLLK